MSARQRREAHDRAWQKGRDARDAGKDCFEANPYKRPTYAKTGNSMPEGSWSLWPTFNCGWQERDSEITQENKQ